MIAFTARLDISDHRDRSESADPADTNEPMDSSDPNDPTLPIEAMEPTLPIDRIDPRLPIDRMESLDHSDQSEPIVKDPFLKSAMQHVRACSTRGGGWEGTDGERGAHPGGPNR